jgi:DNA-3-methyladenine glycosylase II
MECSSHNVCRVVVVCIAWRAEDLALQEGARIGFGLKRCPNTKEMTELGETWRPWRGVAAHRLWN